MLACVLHLKGSWEEHFPLVEFAYNNSYQEIIQASIQATQDCETSEGVMAAPRSEGGDIGM